MISARTSQNLVVLSPSAAFHTQQENAGFFETGFLEQKHREPSVKGVSSGDLPSGKMWDHLGSEPETGRLLRVRALPGSCLLLDHLLTL